jgi:hypothetical protein
VSAATAILELLGELAGLARDIVQAESEGKSVRVEDVLPAPLQTTLRRQIADARARVKFASRS